MHNKNGIEWNMQNYSVFSNMCNNRSTLHKLHLYCVKHSNCALKALATVERKGPF